MTLAEYADLLIEPDWKQRAACRDMDSSLFFPTDRGDSANKTRLARKVCQGCATQEPCLEYALSYPPSGDYGIWGGTNAQQRRKLRRRQAA